MQLQRRSVKTKSSYLRIGSAISSPAGINADVSLLFNLFISDQPNSNQTLVVSKAPFYISNKSLHYDLKISTVTELAKLHYKRFNSRLTQHPNPLITHLSSSTILGNHQKKNKKTVVS
ncbi:zinc finger MYM-type protein 6-like [Aphis craccivora]|uniref:Zinc finger MYM-type protein 6-like n=1 Tax=Aphis craccivora TaxID=307492 RepID=A0A6G0YZ81_APHCR|nr:zinc finger MYM-type protein 6-like [Aphis craccivora]